MGRTLWGEGSPGRGALAPQCWAGQAVRPLHITFTAVHCRLPCRSYWSPAATTGQRYIYTGSFDGRVHVYGERAERGVSQAEGGLREGLPVFCWCFVGVEGEREGVFVLLAQVELLLLRIATVLLTVVFLLPAWRLLGCPPADAITAQAVAKLGGYHRE